MPTSTLSLVTTARLIRPNLCPDCLNTAIYELKIQKRQKSDKRLTQFCQSSPNRQLFVRQ